MGWTSKLRGWLRSPEVLVVFFLAIVLGFYFGVWIPRRQAYFTNRNIRALGVLSDQLRAKIETVPKTLNNLSRAVGESKETNVVFQSIKSGLSLFPSLSLVGEPTVEQANTNSAGDSLTMRVDGDLASPVILFAYTNQIGSNPPRRLLTMVVKSEIETLVGSQSLFDGLIIAQADGKVLFQRSPAGWRALRIDTLFDKNKDSINPLERQSSFITQTRLGKEDFKLFLYPLAFSNNSFRLETNRWWVCGLVEAKRFTSESWTFSHLVLVWFIFAVLLLAFSLPQLKIWLMGLREEFSQGWAMFFVVSALFLCSLLSLLATNLWMHHGMEQTVREQLGELAKSIRENASRELGAMYEQLSDFQDREKEDRDGGARYLSNPDWRYYTDLLANPRLPPGAATNHYAYYLQAAWVRTDGWQRKKWTIRPEPSPFVDLKERRYFSDAISDRSSLYKFPIKFNNQWEAFWFEPVLSWSTGEASAVLSKTDVEKREVLMLEGKPLSLLNPILPLGFGFCVVASDGQVLFHSDSNRNLRENFLTECDHDRRVRSALGTGIIDTFSVWYQGKKHLVHFSPFLPGSSWSIVVFQNQHLLDSMMFDIFLVSLVLSFIYLTLFSAIPLLTLVWPSLRRIAARIFWPDLSKPEGYWAILWINVGLIFVFWAIFRNDPEGVILRGFFLGLAGLGAFVLVRLCIRAPIKDGAVDRASARAGFLLALASLCLLVSIMPACCYFQAVFHLQTDLYVKVGQLHLVRALENRQTRIQNEYRRVKCDPDFIQRRRAEKMDQFVQPFFNTEISEAPEHDDSESPEKLSLIIRFISMFRPTHYQSGVEIYGAFQQGSMDTNTFHWDNRAQKLDSKSSGQNPSERREDHRVTLHKKLAADSGVLHIQTNLPGSAGLGLIAPGFALGLVASLYFAWAVARNVFLIFISGAPRPITSRDLPTPNLLVLDALGYHASSVAHSDPGVINLTLERDSDRWLALAADVPFRPLFCPSTLTITHFEADWTNPALNQQKFAFISRLLQMCSVRLHLVSRVHPSFFPLPSPTVGSTAPDAIERWSRLFGFFEHIYLVPDLLARGGGGEGDHRAIWLVCSPEERLALYHIAKNGFISSRFPELPYLLQRGLVCRDSHLSLISQSFARFVRESFAPEIAKSRAIAEKDSTWNVVKGPVKTILLIFSLLMFLTQRELFNSVAESTATLTGAIPKLLDLVNLFQKAPKP